MTTWSGRCSCLQQQCSGSRSFASFQRLIILNLHYAVDVASVSVFYENVFTACWGRKKEKKGRHDRRVELNGMKYELITKMFFSFFSPFNSFSLRKPFSAVNSMRISYFFSVSFSLCLIFSFASEIFHARYWFLLIFCLLSFIPFTRRSNNSQKRTHVVCVRSICERIFCLVRIFSIHRPPPSYSHHSICRCVCLRVLFNIVFTPVVF